MAKCENRTKRSYLTIILFFYSKRHSAVYILSNPAIFDHILQQGKFSMVDVYLSLAKHHTIKSFDHSQGNFIDVGKPEAIGQAEGMFS